MDIKGKRAIVTGSAGGIGRATAVMLAQRDAAEIALVDVNAAGLAETARLVEAEGARASVHRLDLSDIPATEAWFRAHGDVDILHHNAGVVDRKSVVEGKSVSVRLDLGGSRITKK